MGFIKRFLKNLLEEFLKNKKRSTQAFNPALCKEMIPADTYMNYGQIPLECSPDLSEQYLIQRIKIKKNEYELNVRKCLPIIYLWEKEKLTINFHDDKKIEFCDTYPDKCKQFPPIYIKLSENSELIINTVESEMPMINDKPLINYIGGYSVYCDTDAERNYKVSINYNWTPPTPKKKQ